MTKPALGYWAIRGLVAAIKAELAYLGVDADLHDYEVGDAPNYARDSWLAVKPTLGLDFPNLPYYVDGDVKLTQSQAILRFIARKYGATSGLYNGTPEELAHIDMMMDQVIDWRNAQSRVAYGGGVEGYVATQLPGFLAGFEHALARAKTPFVAGPHITLADFVFYEVADAARQMAKETGGVADLLAAYPHVAAVVAAFEKDPKIAKYHASPSYIARPFNNKMAQWK